MSASACTRSMPGCRRCRRQWTIAPTDLLIGDSTYTRAMLDKCQSRSDEPSAGSSQCTTSAVVDADEPRWSSSERVLIQIRRATSHRGRVPNSESVPSPSLVQRHSTLLPLIISTKEDDVFVVVCLLAILRKNFRTDLYEISREGWQWTSEQLVKFR